MNDKVQPTKCDLLIVNGYVLTMDQSRTIYAPGAIAVTGNTITAVGSEADIVENFA